MPISTGMILFFKHQSKNVVAKIAASLEITKGCFV